MAIRPIVTTRPGLGEVIAGGRLAEPARLGLRSSARWALGCFAMDVAMLVLAALATQLSSSASGVPAPSVAWLVTFSLLAIVFLRLRGLYAPTLHLRILDDLRGVVVATLLAAMTVLTLRALLDGNGDLAGEVFRPWAFAAIYVGVGRIVLFRWQKRARREGEAVRPTLIVGAGKIGHLTAKRLLHQPELGLRPVGFLDKEPLAGDDELPVLGASWDLERVIEQHGVQQVLVTFSTAPDEVLLELVRRCDELGVPVALVPRLFEKMAERITVEYIGGLPLITAHPADPKSWQFAVKYAIDRILAAAAIVLALPLFTGAGLAVLLSLGRPILFRQTRVGRDGRVFDIFKFRTMRALDPDASVAIDLPDDVAPGGVEGEDRRTRVGTFLRRSSLDELPQLLNVLRGEMTLVGPRPERPEFVEQFNQSVHRYGDRHRVKSGITGWAQVHGLRGRTSIADRAEWDNYYIENFSLWLDLKILLLTTVAIFSIYRNVE